MLQLRIGLHQTSATEPVLAVVFNHHCRRHLLMLGVQIGMQKLLKLHVEKLICEEN